MQYGLKIESSLRLGVTLEGVIMKKTIGKKIEIIKEDPVAKALMGPTLPDEGEGFQESLPQE